MKIRNQSPKAGTELQFEYLEKHVDKSLLDQVRYALRFQKKYHYIQPNQIFFGKKIHMINLTYSLGLRTQLITVSMIGMYLILIGPMKNIETILMFLQTDVWL